jgi:endonuclease YncB( thermonuclease family)
LQGEDSLQYRCGAKAANELDAFIARRPVDCSPISLDQYRRTVAVCSIDGVGLQIILVEEHAATSLTLSRRVPVAHSNQRFDNKCNSKTASKIAAPGNEQAVVSRAHLRITRGKRRGSKYG